MGDVINSFISRRQEQIRIDEAMEELFNRRIGEMIDEYEKEKMDCSL